MKRLVNQQPEVKNYFDTVVDDLYITTHPIKCSSLNSITYVMLKRQQNKIL